MPQKSEEFVCRKSRFVHHILCESPFISRDFYVIRPLTSWHILGSYCLLIWGAGVVEIVFIHLQPWEVLPFLTMQRQRCVKILCPKDPAFYTPLALNCQKGQHLSALEVYKNQSPTLRRIKLTPDPDTFEKYRDTPPSSWQRVVYAPPICITIRLLICIAMLLQKYWGQGSVEHPQHTPRPKQPEQ